MSRPPIRFSRSDYEQLPEHIHAELIEGDLVMIPAPTHWHERLASALQGAVFVHLGSRARDRVFGSRFEITVKQGDDESIIQPDVVVLPEGTRATGPDWKPPTPIWVAEVLSPSTAERDRGVKLRLYARAGVQEAWIVDPERETVEVHDLVGGGKLLYARGERAESRAIAGFGLDVEGLFAVGA